MPQQFYRGPGLTLVVCLLLHLVSFTHEVVVLAYFYRLKRFIALYCASAAFFLSGLVCTGAAWVCKRGACGLLPLKEKPILLACPLALLFGWGQLVIVVLAVQDYYDRATHPDALERPMPSTRRRSRRGVPTSPSEIAVQLDTRVELGANRSEALLSPVALEASINTSQGPPADREETSQRRLSSRLSSRTQQEALRPWQAHGGPRRFHCKAVDGICEAFVFGAVLETEYWRLGWSPDGPVIREPSWDCSFLHVVTGLAFVIAACSVLELDHAVSDAARKFMREFFWYTPVHWLFRGAEITLRVSMHSMFLVLMQNHRLCWVPLFASFSGTLLCVSVLSGVERIYTIPGVSFLLKLLVSTLCILSDLFLFIDHPQERHASRRISFWLLLRNLAEVLALPGLVWLQVTHGDPDVLDMPKIWPFLGFDSPQPSLHGKAFIMLIAIMAVYFFLRLALPRILPQPFWDLYAACRAGRYEEVQRALGASTGPNVDREDSAGYTPLMLAALHGHENICLLLLFNGARVDIQRRRPSCARPAYCCGALGPPAHLGWTALHLCAWGGSPEHARILQYLLRSLRSSAAIEDAQGNTPLHLAALYGSQEVIRLAAADCPARWFTMRNSAGKLPEDLAQTEEIRVQVQGEASAAAVRSKPPAGAVAAPGAAGTLPAQPREAPRSAPLPAPPDEPVDWAMEPVPVRSLGQELVPDLCTFVLTQCSGLLHDLLNRPLPTLPEDGSTVVGSGSRPALRRATTDPGQLCLGTAEDPFALIEPGDWPRLEQLEPCERLSGQRLPACSNLEDEAGISVWIKPPVEAFVGGGTYGKVFRARWRSAAANGGEAFAVKRLLKRTAVADRESEVSECVRQRPHPCVVRIFDVVDVPSKALILIAMEYCPGPASVVGHDLCKAVQHFAASSAAGVMPAATVRQLFAEVFLGLEHLHVRMRSLLRDLKHHNVGLDLAGHAKLLDFGLGRLDLYAPNAAWSFGAPPGSPGWAAPEIFLNRPYAFHCDFYSLGVLLWTMSTGGVGYGGHPPAGDYGNSFRRHCEDHQLLLACLEHPRHHNSRAMEPGPARDLVQQLISDRPSRRGNHGSLRAHPFLAEAVLPGVRAGTREVAAWVAAGPGIAQALAGTC